MPIRTASTLIKPNTTNAARTAATPPPTACPADHLTIGWSHCIQPHEHYPEPLTAVQADALLTADLDQINCNLEI